MSSLDDYVPSNVKNQEGYQIFAEERRKYRIKYIRSLVAFFLLGVCHNFGSMVMLTAAEDIMELNLIGDRKHLNETIFPISRHCSEIIGTGAILLAFIITGTVVSSIIPFLPWFIHMRMFLSIVLSMMGFCIVSLAKKALTVALVGVVLVSTADVIGEISCIQYTTYFHVNVVSTWASGTGIADTDAPAYSQSGDAEDHKKNKRRKLRYLRSIFAFWLLGVCNNFGISAMLAGAVNIIEVNVQNTTDQVERDCTMSSTGVILVAQYIGAVGTTLITPFVPMLIHCRMVTCLLMYAAGFLLVAFITDFMEVAMLGVALVSISSALGEVSLLQYTSYFSRATLSTFSSGTGAAGLLGALSYTLGVEKGYKYTMLGMISIPVLMGMVFWFLLPIPTEEDKQSVGIQRAWNEREIKTPWMIIVKKSYLVPKVLYKYIAPLGSVYLFEYFINQGMYELIKVQDSLIEKHMQYQWLQVAYQIGVFISRSSVNCIYVKYIWIMALFQFFNVIIFTTAAIYMYINSFWILFALAVEEGLFGGAAYVNTFVKIGREEAEEEKQFMSSMTCFGNNLGIMLAGLLAILAHNLVCKLPPPTQL